MISLPNDPYKAVEIAKHLVGTGIYQLGTGNWNTPEGGKSDCFGFAVNKCFNIVRHRPGFNKGPWATVEDDLNCNSAIEDSEHKKELFIPVTGEIQPGDLLAYPTIDVSNKKFIGHIAIVVSWAPGWKVGDKYAGLWVVQCSGPNGRTPAITMTTAAHWDDHDKLWPKPAHRSKLIRVIQPEAS
jgi:hypothetical protein